MEKSGLTMSGHRFLVILQEALRRLLTLRGRTGAVLCMAPVRSESATSLMEYLTSEISDKIRQQVESVATDQPSGILFSELVKALPRLAIVTLDPVHLVIPYDQVVV